MIDSPRFDSRDAAVTEAVTLLLDGPYLPRLVFILAALGYSSDASALLALQARILSSLTARAGRKSRAGVSGSASASAD